jgi:hypothetical protein
MNEKDIENACVKWLNSREDHRVVGQQVRLPLGTLDVLTLVDSAVPVVIVSEIKVGVINEKACTQLLGYLQQVKYILGECAFPGGLDVPPIGEFECIGMLVGSNINEMTYRVIKTMGMDFVRYTHTASGFEFDWEMHFGSDMDNHPIDRRLLNVGRHLHDWRVRRLITRAQSLDDEERYSAALYDYNKYSHESLSDTVPYWRRPVAKADTE